MEASHPLSWEQVDHPPATHLPPTFSHPVCELADISPPRERWPQTPQTAPRPSTGGRTHWRPHQHTFTHFSCQTCMEKVTVKVKKHKEEQRSGCDYNVTTEHLLHPVTTGYRHFDWNPRSTPSSRTSWTLSWWEQQSRTSCVLFPVTRVILEMQVKCKILPGKKHSRGWDSEQIPGPDEPAQCWKREQAMKEVEESYF